MLHVIATPIGNLQDMTFRAVETLKKLDYVLAEDTRQSKILFNHYSITTPLVSFHKFSEKEQAEKILQDLKEGKEIGLISDAGTPLIADPGFNLVSLCYEENIKVEALPGACSPIQALVLSALSPLPFQWVGFLPKKKNEREQALARYLEYKGTTIAFESPERVLDTLEILHTLSRDTLVVVARELTKKFEEIKKGPPLEVSTYFSTHILKGECILLMEGGKSLEKITLSPVEETLLLIEKGTNKKEAIKIISQKRSISKKELYNLLITPAE